MNINNSTGAARTVPLDDLNQGEPYQFWMRDGSVVIGSFGAFIRQRGRPLTIMVPQPGVVLSFPVTELAEVRAG